MPREHKFLKRSKMTVVSCNRHLEVSFGINHMWFVLNFQDNPATWQDKGYIMAAVFSLITWISIVLSISLVISVNVRKTRIKVQISEEYKIYTKIKVPFRLKIQEQKKEFCKLNAICAKNSILKTSFFILCTTIKKLFSYLNF